MLFVVLAKQVKPVFILLTHTILSQYVKSEALDELLYLLQGATHSSGIVRAKLVTRPVWFLPV